MLYSIILVILVLTTVIQAEPINIEALIRCDPSITSWFGELTIYEDDVFEPDHLMETFTTTNMTQLFVFDPIDPGFDLGFEYEIGYQLKHNCTSTGETLCMSPDYTEVEQVKGAEVILYIQAFESGVEKCRPLALEY